MTNEQIIFAESCKLLEQGILASTGKVDLIEINEAGEQVTRQVDMPEPIHTFAAWKAQGYIVKKGEHAIAKFPIWKYSKKGKEENEDEEKPAKMFWKMAHFFKYSQVEKA